MGEYLVFETLGSFSANEVKKFRDFLRSPFYNKSPKIIGFYDYFLKNSNNIYNRLEKGNIIKDIAADLNMKIPTLRNLMSDLYKLSKSFLSITNFSTDLPDIKHRLRKELIKRNLAESSRIEIFSSEGTVSDLSLDSGIYFSKFTNAVDEYNYARIFSNDNNVKKISALQKTLDNKSLYLSAHYITEIIKDMLLYKSNCDLYNYSYDREHRYSTLKTVEIDHIISILKPRFNLNKELFLLQLYYRLFKAYSDSKQDIKEYSEIKELIRSKSSYISHIETSTLYQFLFHVFLMDYKKDELDGRIEGELIDLSKEIIRGEYYYTEYSRYLPLHLFRSIILLYANLPENSFLEMFIQDFLDKLHNKYSDNCRDYANAFLSFKRSEFDKSLEYLNRVRIDHFLFKLDIKSLLLRIYIEKNETIAAMSVIDSFRHFLNNNYIFSDSIRSCYKNFLHFSGRIIRYLDFPDQVDIGFIAKELSAFQFVKYKKWLVNKMKDLIL